MPVDLNEDERQLVERVVGRYDRADKGLHGFWRGRWDHYAALYHSYNDFRKSWQQANPRDRDSLRGDAQREFGAELFIPHTFATVELVVARSLGTPPKMIFRPKTPDAEEFTEHVRCLIGEQQSNIDYELVVQAVGKSGQIFNLGVQKVGWREDVRQTRNRKKVMGQWLDGNPEQEVVFNGPTAEYVSPYDFIWDPIATELGNMTWCIHRTWRTDEYVLRKCGLLDGQDPAEADWTALGDRLTPEDIRMGSSGREKYAEIQRRRLEVEGQNAPTGGDGLSDNIHEIWEYHDPIQRKVVVVLDRVLPVAEFEAPNWRGDLPFQIYRPVWVPDRLVGKGAIEPTEGLQDETNMLRSNRMWSQLFKLHQGYAYNDGLVDVDDIKIGPGSLVAVNGDPTGILQPLVGGDIPPSSYQEEAALLADWFRTSGLGDPTEPAAGGGETATGIQLVQQATQARIKVTTDRARVEIVKPAARQWLQLNRQRLLAPTDIRKPAGATPDEPYRQWEWLTVGPDQLGFDYEVDVEGGLESENTAQARQDGERLLQLSGDDRLDGERLLPVALEKLGIRDPQQYIAHKAPGLDPAAVYKALTDAMLPPPVADSLVRSLVAAQQQGGGGQ